MKTIKVVENEEILSMMEKISEKEKQNGHERIKFRFAWAEFKYFEYDYDINEFELQVCTETLPSKEPFYWLSSEVFKETMNSIKERGLCLGAYFKKKEIDDMGVKVYLVSLLLL